MPAESDTVRGRQDGGLVFPLRLVKSGGRGRRVAEKGKAAWSFTPATEGMLVSGRSPFPLIHRGGWLKTHLVAKNPLSG